MFSALNWDAEAPARLFFESSLVVLGVMIGAAWQSANDSFNRRNDGIGNNQAYLKGPQVFRKWVAWNFYRLLLILFAGPIAVANGIFYTSPVLRSYNFPDWSFVILIVIQMAVCMALLIRTNRGYEAWVEANEKLMDPVSWDLNHPAEAEKPKK